MKKLIPYILVSIACILLVACGGKDEDKTVKNATEATSVTTEATTEVTTKAVTTTVTKATTKATTTEKPEEETEAPTEAEDEVVEDQQEEEVPSGGSFDSSDLYVYYGGYSLTVNQDMSTFMPASSVDSSPSCYYEGDDKIFHYGDMDVYTYPSGGADYVLDISIVSSSVSTAKGLTVGMSVNDAIAMYGTGTDSGNMYTWYGGGGYMYVTYSGDTITSIGIATQN